MYEIIGVKISDTEPIYFCNIYDFNLQIGDFCIVEVDKKYEFAEVVINPRMIMENEYVGTIYKVIRKANFSDLKRKEDIVKKEQEAKEICEQKIKEFYLPIELLEVRCDFDDNKLTFLLLSEKKVQLKEFGDMLRSIFKVKVELKFAGVRDEAKLIGGYGHCGCRLCCTLFKQNLEAITIKMVREQDLSLKPTKNIGICGRLMCCLAYEYEFYKEVKKQYPKIGEEITTSTLKGKVVGYNILKEVVMVEIKNQEIRKIQFKDIIKQGEK